MRAPAINLDRLGPPLRRLQRGKEELAHLEVIVVVGHAPRGTNHCLDCASRVTIPVRLLGSLHVVPPLFALIQHFTTAKLLNPTN